jgi:imidazolonepropionase-like amidohydrolase
MKRRLISFALILVSGGVAAADDAVLAIKAKRIYTSAGAPLEGGVILVRDGKIAALGPKVEIPGGAKVIDAGDGVVTPGLVDACCMVDDELSANYFDRWFTDGAKSRGSATDGSACAECASVHRQHADGHLTIGGIPAAVDSKSSDDPYGPPTPPAGGVCRLCTAAHRFHYLLHESAGDTAGSVRPECPVHKPGAMASGTWKSFAMQVSRPADVEGACGCVCAGPRSLAEQVEMFSPGMSARATWAEHASEVVPHTYMIDSVNLLSNDFSRLLRNGVTTVYVSPDPASVIGARGAIVKTGGALSERVIRRADAVKAAMGGDPVRRGRGNMLPGRGRGADQIDVFTRRPTTRMGVEWVFRKAFYDAQRHENGLEMFGADTPPAAAIPALLGILKGEIGLRVQARMQHDIMTALRLAKEFSVKIAIDEGTEAYLCLPELKASNTPVVYGPILFNPSGFRVAQGEVQEARLSTPRRMLDAGVRFCLTAQELRDEEGLARQAMVAAREGLPRDVALASITSTPAALLGVGDQVGTLKAGAAGDLVVWTGDPLDAASKAKVVVVNGRVAYEAN